MKYISDKNYIYYSKSNVPINALGIKNAKEIEELETQLFLKAYEHFHKSLNKKTTFDQKYLKAIHGFGFTKLYSWAGKYRTVNIAKNNAVFCQAIYLQQQIDALFMELKKDNYLKDYKSKTTTEFSEKIAYYMCELIALHPFCELNGKLNSFIEASKACMSRNCKPMEVIIAKGLERKS